MIKIFKLWKSVRGGVTKPVYKIYDPNYWGIGKECEGDWAREWAENEGSGSNYGYTAYWEEVTDENTIKETIEKSISSKKDKIESLKKEIKDLESFRNKYRKEKLEKLNESR